MTFKLGIVSATWEEQHGIVALLEDHKKEIISDRVFHTGKLHGVDVVCVLTRIGKVAAAVTTTTLILEFGVTHVMFTGVAGAGHQGVNVGDIVIGLYSIQHDMNGSPLFEPNEIPLLGIKYFNSDLYLTQAMVYAVSKFHREYKSIIDSEDIELFQLDRMTVHSATIASGDEFVNTEDRRKAIHEQTGAAAVEMEGAAVAQVCHEFSIPFTLMRTISDGANENSFSDYPRFCNKVASLYAFHIIQDFVKNYKAQYNV